MSFVRILWPLAVAAVLAACSGNLGGGQSTLPGTPQGTTGLQQVNPTPTPTPNSASNVATVGEASIAQPLPAVQGWGGTVTFPKPTAAPSPSPNPKATPNGSDAGATSAGPVSIGVTAAVVEPSDAPHFGHHSGGKHADASASAGLLYVTLLATADVALGEYPKFAIDVPRDVAAKYHDRPFELALYDPEAKEKAYRLAVAERDLSSPAPGGMPVATPTPVPLVTSGPVGVNPAPAFTPPPIGQGLAGDALPPERVAFLGTASTLTLRANRPVVFALYAGPAPSPTPTPATKTHGSSPTPAASSTASAKPVASATPSAKPLTSPAAASSASPSPAASPL